MRTSAALLVLTSAVCAQISPSVPRSADEVAVRVGEKVLTRGDLDAETNRKLPFRFHARPDSAQMRAARSAALVELVERTLVHLDAVARGLEASETEIGAAFDRALEQSGPDYRDLDPEQRAMLLQEHRAAVVRRVLVDANLARFRAGLPAVTDDEVEQRYAAVKDELVSPARAHLLHLLVSVPPEASDAEVEACRRRAQVARDAIAGGRPFAEVAREVSQDVYAQQGGDLGFVERGSLRYRDVEAAAFALRRGELSDVLSSMYGFHVVRCVDVVPSSPMSLEAATPGLRQTLADERHAAARAVWMRELRARSPVRVDAPDWAELQPQEWREALPQDR